MRWLVSVSLQFQNLAAPAGPHMELQSHSITKELTILKSPPPSQGLKWKPRSTGPPATRSSSPRQRLHRAREQHPVLPRTEHSSWLRSVMKLRCVATIRIRRDGRLRS